MSEPEPVTAREVAAALVGAFADNLIDALLDGKPYKKELLDLRGALDKLEREDV